MATFDLRIENMHCGSCVRRVMMTLNTLPGTHAEEVRVGSARITTGSTAEPVLEALGAAGFPSKVDSQRA